jgi:hypothetical protein
MNLNLSAIIEKLRSHPQAIAILGSQSEEVLSSLTSGWKKILEENLESAGAELLADLRGKLEASAASNQEKDATIATLQKAGSEIAAQLEASVAAYAEKDKTIADLQDQVKAAAAAPAIESAAAPASTQPVTS